MIVRVHIKMLYQEVIKKLNNKITKRIRDPTTLILKRSFLFCLKNLSIQTYQSTRKEDNMNLLIDFYNILHLQNILELLQYNDIFDNGRRIFMALLSGLRKVAPGAGGACLAIGAYFWMFGGETGKQTAKNGGLEQPLLLQLFLEQMQSFHGYKQMLNSNLHYSA